MTKQRWRKTLFVALIGITLVCAAYVFQYRYFTRMIPLPLAAIEWLYDGGRAAPAPRITPKGEIEFPAYSLMTEAGLRAALEHVRGLSPVKSVNGVIDYQGIDFARWTRQLGRRAMFCTDATLLFMLMARSQGLPAREWWIWASKGYFGGSAHSLVEFYNPALPGWQVVDALTSTIIRDRNGRPVTMGEVLRRFKAEGNDGLVFDQSPNIAALRIDSLDTRYLLTINTTPVLNMKPPTWFAATPKLDLLIAVPVLIDPWRHNIHVFTTKIALLFGALAGLAAVILGVRLSRTRRRRRATATSPP
jgi:hypothetical protein